MPNLPETRPAYFNVPKELLEISRNLGLVAVWQIPKGSVLTIHFGPDNLSQSQAPARTIELKITDPKLHTGVVNSDTNINTNPRTRRDAFMDGTGITIRGTRLERMTDKKVEENFFEGDITKGHFLVLGITDKRRVVVPKFPVQQVQLNGINLFR